MRCETHGQAWWRKEEFPVFQAGKCQNPIGTVHGGLAATLLNSAMACAIHTMLPAGTSYTTLEIKVNYLRLNLYIERSNTGAMQGKASGMLPRKLLPQTWLYRFPGPKVPGRYVVGDPGRHALALSQS